MRPIKFRAWDKKEKSWVTGKPGMQGNDKIFFSEQEVGDGRYIIDRWDWIEVMQSTGLLDKNGKEIYEGDVLKDGRGQFGKVLWHRNSFLVEWDERGSDGHLLQDRMIDDCFGYGEVIGNIHENPELLK